jgi:hypothetical protein
MPFSVTVWDWGENDKRVQVDYSARRTDEPIDSSHSGEARMVGGAPPTIWARHGKRLGGAHPTERPLLGVPIATDTVSEFPLEARKPGLGKDERPSEDLIPGFRWSGRIRQQYRSGSGEESLLPRPLRTVRELAPHTAHAFTNAPRGTRPFWQRPSRYAPGADGPSARPSSLRGTASRAHAREPHQQAFLLPTYLPVFLSRLIEGLS